MCSYHLHRRAQAKASHTHAQAKASDAYAQAKASAEPRRGGGAMRDDHGKIGLRALSSTAATLRRPHYYIATLVVAAMLGRAASDNFIRDPSVSKVVSKWLDEYGLSTRVKTDKKTVSYEEGRRRSGCFWRNSIRIRWYFHPAEFQFDAYDHTPVVRNMSAETTVAIKGSQVVAPSENHREKKDRHTLLLFSSSDKRRIAPEVCFKGSNISNIASPEASELPVAVPPY